MYAYSIMRQQKSHDINESLRTDARRLVITLIAVAILVTALYLIEQRLHFVERFVVLLTTKVAASPAPSVETTQPQTSPTPAKK